MLNSLTTKARSIYQKLSRNLSDKDMDLVVDLIEAIKYPHEGPPSKKFKFVLDFKQEEEIYSGEIEAEDVDHARDLILEELEKGLSVQDNN